MNSPYRSTILLVEDEPSDVFRIERALRKTNLPISLTVVSDGEQAVHYLSGQEPFQDRSHYPWPVLVLLDLKLPRLSGFEVLQWRQEQSHLKLLPVVILTSSEENTDIQRAYALGANSYLLKPPSPEALVTLVQTLGAYWGQLNLLPRISLEAPPVNVKEVE